MRLVSLIVLAGLLFSACGADRPDDDSARKAVQAQISGPLADKLRLQAFRKTDGQARELMGVRIYSLEYSATLEFLDDILYEVSGNAIKASPVGPTLNDNRGFSWDAWFNTAVAGRKPGFLGDRLNLVGTVTFEKKESGWVVAGIDFKATMDSSNRAAGHSPEAMAAAEPEKRRQQQVYLKELNDLMKQIGTNFHGAGHDAMTRYLESGGDPSVRIGGYWSLLNVAAVNGYKDVVESLLAIGVDINSKGDDGTPLYWAIASSQPAMALYLIEKGADVNREKSGGWLPLNAADGLDLQDPLTKNVIAALVQRGARKKQ
jgi:hypothetical protein